VVEVAVGEDFSSRAEFRLEVSSVEPLGCSRSAAVPTASTHERGDVGGRHVATRGEAEAGDEEAVFGVDGESSAAGGVVEVGGEGEGEGEWYLPRDEAAYGQLEKRVFSQNGEDGVLSAILVELGFYSVIELA
jgi:hypothetical protein